MKSLALILLLALRATADAQADSLPAPPEMHWADTASGKPFSKDPSVIRFQGKYLMYYSLPGRAGGGMDGWSIGIARSQNLVHWEPVAQLKPAQACDAKGLAAPAAWVRDGKVHLFYQTYGNGPKDAICHAWSEDGIRFTRNPDNPVFSPTGDWTSGRAIDAEVSCGCDFTPLGEDAVAIADDGAVGHAALAGPDAHGGLGGFGENGRERAVEIIGLVFNGATFFGREQRDVVRGCGNAMQAERAEDRKDGCFHGRHGGFNVLRKVRCGVSG